MSPAEKAQELYLEFYTLFRKNGVDCESSVVKECALVAAGHALSASWWSSTKMMAAPYRRSQKEFWEAVKTKIQKR